MQGNLIPPILSEATDAGPGSVGSPPPADSIPVQPGHDAGAAGGGPALIRDASLLQGLRTLRQSQDHPSSSQQQLNETHESREGELKARLDQAQQIIEAGRGDLARLQKLLDEREKALSLQQAQYQSQLKGVQESLAQARREIQRANGDLHELRQRCAVLEQEVDRRERWGHDLENQLRVAREQLGSRDAVLERLQRRGEELEQQHQRREQDHASRVEELERDLLAAREQLGSRDAVLERLQRRGEELEQQHQRREQDHASRVEELEQDLQAVREQLGSRDAELERLQRRCEQLERQDNAVRSEAQADSGTFIRDPETERLRDELIAVQQMLEDLPDIYEHKFRQRLQPLLEQRDWLMHENSWLRAELPAPRPELPAAPESGPGGIAEATPGSGLGQRVLSLSLFGRLGRRLQGRLRSGVDLNSDPGPAAERPGANLSVQSDDGPPTDASAGPTHR